MPADQLRAMSSSKISYAHQFLILQKVIDQSRAGFLTYFERQSLAKLQRAFDDLNEMSAQERLSLAIAKTKSLIAKLEQVDDSSKLLKRFMDNGLYRMLYHNPKLKGIDDQGMLKQLLKNGFIGVGVSAVAVLLFTTASLLGAPVAISVITTALFAAAMTYISALAYGVVNDIFATKSNLPYFLLGHQPQQHSLLRTNDPVAQGVAWGVAATFGPAVLASIVFGIATVITASFVPIATFVFPAMLIAMPLIAVGAHFFAKRKAKEYLTVGVSGQDLENVTLGANWYQLQGLKLMSPTKEEKSAWLANSDRNLFGFTKVPLIGLGSLVGLVTLSCVHSLLPTILFSATVATIMPVAFAAVALFALTAAGIYTYVNRNKQIDNRFKLAFDAEPNNVDELYLDDDYERVTQLIEARSVDRALANTTISDPGHFPSPIRAAIRSQERDPQPSSAIFSALNTQS